MLELPQEHHHELTAAVDALTMQLIARVPLYRDATGTVLVPLHRLLDTAELDPLLEATALTLLHPQTYTLAPRATVLMVPLGEAFAILPFSRHFPEALAHVLQIVAMQTAAEMRPASSPALPCVPGARTRSGYRHALEGLGLARVEHRKIPLIIDRIRDVPAHGMHGLIEILGTGTEIIGPTRFPARPVQPVGCERGERPITPEFSVPQGVGDGRAHPQQLGARLVHRVILAHGRVSVWREAQPPTAMGERIKKGARLHKKGFLPIPPHVVLGMRGVGQKPPIMTNIHIRQGLSNTFLPAYSPERGPISYLSPTTCLPHGQPCPTRPSTLSGSFGEISNDKPVCMFSRHRPVPSIDPS